MRSLLCRLGGVVMILFSGTAHAAWYEAQSKHFVIYADANPKKLADFANWLERFDQSVRLATHMDDPPVGLGNRLTVFVLPNADAVRSIMGDKTGFFEGFYTGRVTGSLAYVPKNSLEADGSDPVFFHEYTHHLMMQDLNHPYPEWYVEGYAEFFSTVKFDRDGSVWLGAANQGRAYGLFEGPKLAVETLFAGLDPKFTKEQDDVFYGRSWLLAHYLLMDGHRKGQLAKYIDAISHGASPLDAGRQAFGDLAQLDRELDAYRSKPLLEFKIPASQIHIEPIQVTPLSAGAGQVILARARIKNGVKGDEAQSLLSQVLSVEKLFPNDELVEETLAEAEIAAGKYQPAEAAATRALAANPSSTEAMVLKGRAIAEEADHVEGQGRGKLFEQARQVFIAANKIDTEDPGPLFEFYRTFAMEGIRPTDNAIAALHYASDLAPQDLGVRMNSAIAYLDEGKFSDARSTLSVVAYSPHAKEAADVAKRMIADIDAGKGKAALLELRASGPMTGSH
jgi:Flp pilus assembly protein TadD